MKTFYQQTRNAVLPGLILLLCGTLSFSQNGQAEKKKKSSIFELFVSEKYTEFDLTIGFEQLESVKKTNDYIPAVLELDIENETAKKWDIEVKARGRYRRRICSFPPIKLKFDKGDLSEKGYKKDNDMKLVTHCVDDYTGKENVLREFLVYKLYEIFSDRYFRTQLVKVKYRDSESSKKMNGVGILIEDDETVERRLTAKTCEGCFSMPQDSFFVDNLHIASLFQYMIGNADWSIEMSRNLELMQCQEEFKYFIVPYDFDFSGLVNASYAVPNSNFNQKDIRDRIFLGLFKNANELRPYCEYFKSKKEEVINYVKSFKELPAFSRRDIIEYIETFYTSLEDETFYANLKKG